jgi:RNA polymerase-binding transcription factor DksA
MHLGDVGSDVYAQELSATLLEAETRIRNEVVAALDRIERGSFGTCEACSTAIPAARLDALPYARYCVQCAELIGTGQVANFNEGRQQQWPREYDPQQDGSEADWPADTRNPAPFSSRNPVDSRGDERADIHAAGTPGGGSAMGGLAGTTVGRGDPTDAGLEHAMGSGNFDSAVDDDDEETTTYAGPSGGAAGGTPAGKRSSRGKSRR